MTATRHLPMYSPEPAPPAEHAAPAAPALLSRGERASLSALAAAVIPKGAIVPGAGAETVAKVEALLSSVPKEIGATYRAVLLAMEAAARLRFRAPLSALPAPALLRLCQEMADGGWARRNLLRMLLTPLKVLHFDDPALLRRLGGGGGGAVSAGDDRPRYVRDRTQSAAELPDGEELECDAVVIGSGAGGAVAAKELAEAGCAVILLEEGDYHARADFTGSAFALQRRLYRDFGATVALGNTAIPVPIGMGVGGTTTINSGTCYRMPQRVLRGWQEELGLSELTDDEMGKSYERVEEVLRVAPARADLLGGTARAIGRGCDALGYLHGPLVRNAPDCDGQGVCCFGCPTDAKRSTNVSYVPLALRAGAQLLTSARVESLIIEGGRAAGVKVATAGGRRFSVRARAVVLAAGSLLTPVLLQRDPAARAALSRSGQLGRNLTIHPVAAVYALMPEAVRAFAAIPQGYAIEEFHGEGLLMEGAFLPLDITAGSVTCFGPRFTEIMEAYERMSCFGFLIEEESRGAVRPGPGGRPLITYYLKDVDVARIKRGLEVLMRVYLAAGAERVVPEVHGFPEVRTREDVRRFRAARLSARDLELTAYHPLGTARMGADPRGSVVGPDQQAHDLPGLYICDGSVVPTSPAVNPQLTIMALSTRAARLLSTRL